MTVASVCVVAVVCLMGFQETLARDFTRTWKQAMGAINSSVSRYFTNTRDGMEILKQVLTQLLLYYTRFQVPCPVLLC